MMKQSKAVGLYFVSCVYTCSAIQSDVSKAGGKRNLQLDEGFDNIESFNSSSKTSLPVELEYWLQVTSSLDERINELIAEMDAEMVEDVEKAFAKDDFTGANITVDAIETNVLRKLHHSHPPFQPCGSNTINVPNI